MLLRFWNTDDNEKKRLLVLSTDQIMHFFGINLYFQFFQVEAGTIQMGFSQ